MRLISAAIVSALVVGAALPAAAASSCEAQIPQAQRFVGRLEPGPNTRAAERFIERARRAPSERQCLADLRQADVYARRSAAADRRGTSGYGSSVPPTRQCADLLHQDRPGGSDYHGPLVPGCPRR